MIHQDPKNVDQSQTESMIRKLTVKAMIRDFDSGTYSPSRVANELAKRQKKVIYFKYFFIYLHEFKTCLILERNYSTRM